MSKIPIIYDEFSTGLKYIKIGTGSKTIIMMHGGPGNDLPRGFYLKAFQSFYRQLVPVYTVYFITRKSGLTPDYSLERMADDVAEAIKFDLGGKIHAIIGLSYGGMILPIVAAKYPQVAEKFIILSSAHKISEDGKKIDLKFAQLQSQGKEGRAMACILDAILPKGIVRWLAKGLVRVMGIFPAKHNSETYAKDVLIEAEIEITQSPEAFLAQIQPYILILAGDKDYYFPKEYLQECDLMIPHSTLKLYAGKGHEVFAHKELQLDLIAYLNAKA